MKRKINIVEPNTLEVINNKTYLVKKKNNDEYHQEIANFKAEIIKISCYYSDGVECNKKQFTIEIVNENKSKMTVSINAEDFSSMNWVVENCDVNAVIKPIGNAKPLLSHYILENSDPVTCNIYTSIGYREIDNEWYFFHAGGAISCDGHDNDINVELPHELEKYSLLEPFEDKDEQAELIGNVLDIYFLSFNNTMIGLVILINVSKSILSKSLQIRDSTSLVGEKSSLKTTCGLTALSFYGLEFMLKKEPNIGWDSTSNSIQDLIIKSHNVPVLIDDYTFNGSNNRELQKSAEQIYRGVSNNTSRSRLGEPQKLADCVLFSTGEDSCRESKKSLNSRISYVEICKDDIDRVNASYFEEMACNGDLTRFTFCLIKIYLKEKKKLDLDLRNEVNDVRDKFSKILSKSGHEIVHDRIPENIATSYVCIKWLYKKIKEMGVITNEQYSDYCKSARNNLLDLAKKQKEFIEYHTKSEIIFGGIIDSLKNGKIHLKDHKTNEKPKLNRSNMGLVGWKNNKPLGRQVGWIDTSNKTVYIDSAVEIDFLLSLVPGKYKNELSSMAGEKRFWKVLKEEAAIVCKAKDRNTVTLGGIVTGKQVQYAYQLNQKLF